MLWEYLKRKMLERYNALICEDDAKITYEEAVIFAEQFSENLRGLKCCAILCSSEMAAGIALLSCFSAEVTAVPLSLRYGEVHCNKILDAINPEALITDSDGTLQVIKASDSKYSEPENRPAIIMCTSGTTGAPKGAMLSERNILSNVCDIASYFGIGIKDRILIARPLYHSAVLTGEYLTSLVKGAEIRFYSGTFNPSVMLKLIEKYSITAFCGTPTLLGIMARFNRTPNANILKNICISGECMSPETGKRIAAAFPFADIYHVYGLTEAGPRVTYLPPHLFNKYPEYVGIPLNSVSIKILREDGTQANAEETGVLWVKGENIMQGYYNNTKKTAEIMKSGWLCTGDLAEISDLGLLKIKGRSDDMIIKAGMNIYPQEIESVLKKDPRVKEALIYAENDERLGIQLALNIAGDFSCISEIRKLCAESLPAYQVPVKITLLAELPKNGSGKALRRR